ncbi:AAA-ATPase ASD, mitochondrial-like [Lolium rigidum]|uniref:AAA-ATPase ASD, mitochondrial-like n=1 Tax=Lolium rigidum TaxID=89674 RepID=UPI001F5C5A78|nr:AAA-ATPase ASD, mitochondrial-like [Lolium rigidum]
METHVDGGHGHGYGWSGSLASLVFLCSMIARQCIPAQLKTYLDALATRIHNALSPYDTISIYERHQVFCWRCNAYLNAEAYLRETRTRRVRCLRATLASGAARMSLAFDDYEELVDDFNGARIWWRKIKELPRAHGTATIAIAKHGWHEEESRAYRLTFHRRHRALIENEYLRHVQAQGRVVNARNRRRRFYTNKPSRDWFCRYDFWSSVKFDHPSTFATLAMDPGRKQDILDDLEMFRRGKEYYASVGKAWKRGYLLSGPSGTGKSTLIAAIANLLEYDVYVLDLSTIKTNSELRRLFMTTSHKCLIVIEDIDSSVDLSTAKRDKDTTTSDGSNDDEDNKGVTLSGLLSFVDGLWSACGGQRIIVLTTNYKENLDPALIRRGRMDLHIEMPFCCFESFKVLAYNYLGVTDHNLFCEIRQLLAEVNMSPADVAENLMPRSKKKDVDVSLGNLVMALREKVFTGNKDLHDDEDAN